MLHSALVTAALLLAPPRGASANGALPYSLGILVPEDRPEQIILATSFGLISSDDGAATWLWTCEQDAILGGHAYALGGQTRERLFGLSLSGWLAFSDDGSCTWTRAGGVVAKAAATDHLLAIAGTAADGGVSQAIYPSMDGGTTFDATPLFAAPADVTLTSVEIARGNPEIVYVAMYRHTPGTKYQPMLAR